MFGASVSAVDPFSMLTMMHDPARESNALLHSLVFGESVLNGTVLW